ncbi:TPA: hypothetical protein LSH94_003453 [Morganella morganii]|nr:hypothetical protein [Morganella morganii]
MKNKRLLKESIESLKQLSLEMQDDLDNSNALEKIEDTIKRLESYQECAECNSNTLLNLLGEALKALPAVATLISNLIDKL